MFDSASNIVISHLEAVHSLISVALVHLHLHLYMHSTPPLHLHGVVLKLSTGKTLPLPYHTLVFILPSYISCIHA